MYSFMTNVIINMIFCDEQIELMTTSSLNLLTVNHSNVWLLNMCKHCNHFTHKSAFVYVHYILVLSDHVSSSCTVMHNFSFLCGSMG